MTAPTVGPPGLRGELLAAAVDYAARGWPVVALHHVTRPGTKKGASRARCSCGRTGCTSQGKHPRTKHGLKDATTNVDQVRAMWRRWPDANVGLITGVVFDVLDLDRPNALTVLKTAIPAGGDLNPGRMAQTGLGVHVFIEPTGAGNRTGLIRQDSGIDWRGRDGYIVAPPSGHYRGGAYRWPPDAGPDHPAVPCPDWLRTLVLTPSAPTTAAPAGVSRGPVRGTAYGCAVLEREIGRLALTPEGNRNDTLVRSAFVLGQLVGSDDLDVAQAVAALLTVAGRWDDLRKSTGTIERGVAAGIRNPRRRDR